VLNVFKDGGPLDTGLAYDTRYLLHVRPDTKGIAEYTWTAEIITGQSGRSARVWRWKGEDG
jgi:hypothetical protein